MWKVWLQHVVRDEGRSLKMPSRHRGHTSTSSACGVVDESSVAIAEGEAGESPSMASA